MWRFLLFGVAVGFLLFLFCFFRSTQRCKSEEIDRALDVWRLSFSCWRANRVEREKGMCIKCYCFRKMLQTVLQFRMAVGPGAYEIEEKEETFQIVKSNQYFESVTSREEL